MALKKSEKTEALAGTSLQYAAPEEHFGLNLNIQGPEKVGKTFLALATAPEPVSYLNGDRDNSRLLRYIINSLKRRVLVGDYRYSLPGPKQITRKMDSNEVNRILDGNRSVAAPALQRFLQDFEASLKSPKVRSVVVDTGTWTYQTSRLAKFGTVSPPKWSAQEYKADMEAILHLSDEYRKLVIWVHREVPEWEDFVNPETGEKDSRTTGRMKLEGFDRIGYVMDGSIRLDHDLDTLERKASIISSIRGEGKIFEGAAVTIPEIAAYLTRTKKEDWL